jgi:flagellar basal body L-ring protein FlgH
MAVLPHVVQVVVAWLEQTGQRSVVIERDGRRIEVTGRVRPADIEAMWNLLGQGDAEADGSGQSDESADR